MAKTSYFIGSFYESAKLGKLKSAETRRRMTLAQMGNKNAVGNTNTRGSKLTDAHKSKIREALKGRPGISPSIETREKLRQFNLGKKHSELTKQKIREKNIGRKMSEEAKNKIRLGLTGNKNSLGHICTDETKQKIRETKIGNKNGMFGRIVSIETIAKRIAKTKGKKRTPEQCEKIRQGRIAKGGWVISDETRKKLSESHKGQIAWNKGIKGYKKKKK